MRKYLSFFFALGIMLMPHVAWADSVKPVASVSEGVRTCTFTHDHVSDFRMDGLSLYADSGKVLSSFMLSAQRLPSLSASLSGDMTNVTDGVDGFRLLPSGEHFSEPATLALAYNPARLPIGYSPEDIYTFCYDSAVGHWTRLHRTRVDTLNKMVYSLTTHFTDFANFVIRVPEMPETKAFVPTDMQDLPDPDPLTGVPMIAAPRANNMGTAELTYPITLPPGRHGLQPDLDLHYSSAGGNGLLGVGWSFSQPAITIDTRWGVPRYDLRYETEAYLVNGEPVLLHDANGSPIPLPHQQAGFRPRSTRATRFYPRDQRNQSKVVRHGQVPSRYWWTVITTDGMTYYYGYDPIDGHLDENSILRTSNGNIGYWALTCIVDRYDNYVHYINTKDDNEILISQIDYTGNSSWHQNPTYSVYLFYSPRSDSQSDARLGLLRKQNSLLCHIQIRMANHSLIGGYQLSYDYGSYSLFKSRLTSIDKIDGFYEWTGKCPESTNELNIINRDADWVSKGDSCYSDITKERVAYESRPGSTTTFTYMDACSPSSLFGTPISLSNSAAEISKSTSSSWNLGGTLTLGLGFRVWNTDASAGANYSYGRSEGNVSSMLIDLNGDGLIDQLTKNGSYVWYRRQTPNHSFEAPVLINGLNVLSRETSSSHNFGLQLAFGASLSFSPTVSDSYTDIYFADINGDGLPDLVTPSGVRLNTLTATGIPSFEPVSDTQEGLVVHSNHCERTITFDGEVDERLECVVTNELVTRIPLSSLLPSDDGESVFIEPDLVPDTLDDESLSKYEPDVWEALPINENPSRTISDNTDKIVSNSPIVNNKPERERSVSLGMRDGEPPVTQDTWLDILQNLYPGDDYTFVLADDYVEVYHLTSDCDSSSGEPNIDIVRVWIADHSGPITLASVAALLQDTTDMRAQSRRADGVRLRIQWNRSVHPLNGRLHADSVRMLYDKVIQADDYSSDTTRYTISVQQGDIFFFRLSARNNRRFDDVSWEQTILTTTNDTLYNSAHDYLCTGYQNFMAPAGDTARVKLSCVNADTVPVHVRALKNTTQFIAFNLAAQTSLDTIISTPVALDDNISFYIDTLSREPLWNKVRVIPSVDYWGSLVIDTLNHTLQDTLHYHPEMCLQHSSFYPQPASFERRVFGPLHKGWGWFAYNDVMHDMQIPLDSLQNEEDVSADYANSHQTALSGYVPVVDTNANDSVKAAQANACFAATGTYDPLGNDKHWVPIHPDYAENRWTAYGNTGSLGQYLHSTARQLTVVADTTVIKEEITEYDSPIPTLHGGLQRVTTIRKSTQSVQYSLSVGFGYFAPSFSWGSYGVRSDYMDMNGDGFPDFVGSGAVQYTRPWGGIGELVPSLTNSFVSSTYSNGYSFSGSRPQGDHITGNGVKDGRMKNSEKSIGISNQSGGDNTITSFTDMNADGLPDIVDASGQRVRYNLGYAFTNWQNMPGLEISSGVHSDASFSLGFSLNQFSISGGVNSSFSNNTALTRLTDIDGDGHPDVVSYDSYSGTTGIRLNSGHMFQSPQSLNMPTVQNSTTTSSGVSVSGTGGFTLFILPIKLTFGIQMCPWAQSNTETNSDFMDMNGDGYVDWVTTTSSGLQVRYNKNGSRPVNLLTSVVNPTGQTISLDYTLSEPSTVHRSRTWNMTDLEDYIPYPSDNTQLLSYDFTYTDPFYDNFEKTDYGYYHVNTADNGAKYIEETYENLHYINHGEKLSDLLLNEFHQPIIGHAHEIRYHDSLDVEHSDVCNDIYLHVGREGYWTDYYETEPAPMITTSYNKFYDNKHNLIRYDDYGDIAITGDEWVQTIAYKPNTAHNMISLPRLEVIHSDSLTGPVMRRRRANYDWSGKPVQIIFEDTHTLQKAIHTIGYDVFGNVNNYCAPWNENYERVNYKYLYDTIAETHVTQVQNQFGETHYFGYDMRHGLRNWSRDPAGNEMHWQYDMMGRLINLTAPKEFRDSLPFSVHYVYRLPYHELPTNPYGMYLYPHVTKVAADSGLVSAEVTLYDARGKEMQKKMWKRVGTAYTWVANGLFLRNQWYNPKTTFDPFVTPAASLWELDMTHHLSYPTDYQYDALDRVTQIDYPDLTHVSHRYHFEHDPILGNYRLAAYKTDENNNTTLTLTSPQQWTILTETPNNERTLYKYNAIGELQQVVDADSYVTNYAYDMFGNRIWRQHPDAGDTWWHYAPDGSLKSTKTARLNLAADSITYEYCFGRLMKIHYPLSPEMNVSNIYDQAGRLGLYIDATGRTRLYYDELGNVRTTIRRVIMPTETSAYTFRTHTEYDSFGRMKYILYPDGDSVAYSYYPSGELSDVERNPLLGSSALVVAKMEYDPMGHNTYREYGNTVQTTYQYEPYRNRLSRLMTEIPSSCILQKIDYYYDGVGNITRIEQDQPACATLGGEYLNDYTYDNNYRLTQAQCNIGSFRYNFQARYSPAGRVGNNYCDNTGIVDVDAIYGYDNHYITHQPRVVHDGKSSAHMQLYWDADGNLFSVEDCKSEQNRFHDWDDAGRMRMFLGSSKSGYYGYDANGERVYKLTGTSSQTYTPQYDIAASVYFDNAVIYPNPYVVITDKGYTKHYYANSERLATVFGQGGWMTMSSNFMDNLTPYEEGLLFNLFFRYKGTFRPFGHPIISDMPNCDINDNVVQEVQYDCDSIDLVELAIEYDEDILAETMLEYKGPQGSEKDVYYTHNDHLGSAAWITDQDAKPVQYLHYLPYGQLLANQSPSGYDERFKFIGKERDWESGYDYFGARYLATTFLHFTSPEPLLDDYLQISPYSYAAWNPIKYYDFRGGNPRSGQPGEWQNGVWKTGADATFAPQSVSYKPVQMNKTVYAERQLNINKGTLSASPSPKENLLNSLNSFEASMIQSPVIQGIAAGMLVAGTASIATEATIAASPTLVGVGYQIQGVALQGMNVVESSARLQFFGSALEGFIHSSLQFPPDIPRYFNNTPVSESGYMIGQLCQKVQKNVAPKFSFESIKKTIDRIVNCNPSDIPQ